MIPSHHVVLCWRDKTEIAAHGFVRENDRCVELLSVRGTCRELTPQIISERKRLDSPSDLGTHRRRADVTCDALISSSLCGELEPGEESERERAISTVSLVKRIEGVERRR